MNACLQLGTLLRVQADVEGAIDAYQKAIDSGHVDAAPMAARDLGLLLTGQGGLDPRLVREDDLQIHRPQGLSHY